MKNIFLVILFLTVNIYSQNDKSIITYSVSMLKIETDSFFEGKKNNPKLKKMVNSFINSKDQIICQLYFNKKEAVFFKSKKLNTEGRKKQLIDILIGSGVYYTNIKDNKILHQKEFAGELFIVESNFFNWKLTQEFKYINNYKCYKAIGTKVVDNNVGVFKNNIIAWYTPEIPMNFGPKEFCGLPGAIIELNDGKLIYKIKKIEISTKKNIKIKKPTKGKILKESEFKLLTKKLFFERNRKNSKNK